jgi:radical SAM superfamily enzyme YgiQ (UPF0313 family)
MKVFLINEPYVPYFNRTQRWAARTRGRVFRAPDWLAYATAVLEAAGVAARLFDFPVNGWDKDELRRLMAAEKPDYVVLDSTTPSIYSDIECARICKEVGGARVIMVGPHASALPEDTLRLADGAVDVICRGEYDYTVLEVVNRGSSLGGVKGIGYFENGRPHLTPDRPLIEDLDALPFPAWHHLDLMQYFDGTKLYPYIDIFSGRGCPHRCMFCLWPQVMHGHKLRLRSPENVVDEMERDIAMCPQVQRHGEFFFEDDTFTLATNNAKAICQEILRRNLKVTFSVNARVDTADRELFALLKRAGCRELLVGFESGDQAMLDRMGKRASLEEARSFMAMAHGANLEVHGCFVLGLPGETPASLAKTIDFALDLGLTTVQFAAAVPFPGTEYFSWCQEADLLTADRWDSWLADGEQTSVVDYPGLSHKSVQKAVDDGLKKFYFRPAFMVNFLLKNRSPWDLYRKLRGGWSFLSYLQATRKEAP